MAERVYCGQCRFYRKWSTSEHSGDWCNYKGHHYKVLREFTDYAGTHRWYEDVDIFPFEANKHFDCSHYEKYIWI